MHNNWNFNDGPIKNEKEDLMNRSSRAKNIAETIKQTKNNQSYVIAITGSHGNGKTSFVNLIKENLINKKNKHQSFREIKRKIKIYIDSYPLFKIINSAIYLIWEFIFSLLLDPIISFFQNLKNKTITKNNEIKILEFNPWIFKEEKNAFIKEFFYEMTNIYVDLAANNWEKRKISNLFNDFFEEWNIEIKMFDFLKLTKKNDFNKNFFEKKKFLNKTFKKFLKNKKIIIIIDDIDRMNKEEILLIFKLTKIILNFFNHTFLLCYDKQTLLNKIFVSKDKKNEELINNLYFEKFIQVDLDLLEPNKRDIKKFFLEEFWKIFNIDLKNYFKKSSRDQELLEHLLLSFNNFREIKIFFNTLIFQKNLIFKKEINLIDFLCIKAIKINLPPIYEWIKKGRISFYKSPNFFKGIDNKNQEFWSRPPTSGMDKTWFQGKNMKIYYFLKNLFPKLSSNIWAISEFNFYEKNSEYEWNKEKRICSNLYFDKYFDFAYSINYIKREEFINLFNKNISFNEIEKKINNFFETKNLIFLLESIREEIQNINKDQWITFFSNIFDWHFFVEEKKNEKSIIFNFSEYLFNLFFDVFKKLKIKEQLDFLEKIIKNTKSIFYTSCFFYKLTTKEEGFQDSHFKNQIPKAKIDFFQKILLKKIKITSKNGDLEKNEKFPLILKFFKKWASKKIFKNYIEKILKTDEGKIFFLKKFSQKFFKNEQENVQIHVKDQKFILELLGENFTKCLNKIYENSFDDETRTLIKAFWNPYKLGPLD